MTQAVVLKSWRRTVLLLSSVLLVLAMLAAAVRSPLAGEGEDAAEFVRGFGEQAVALLADPALSREDRRQGFRELLASGFGIDLIGRFVLGKHWRKASDAEKAEFSSLFETYIVTGYARRLTSYSGERLVVEGSRLKGTRGAIVESHVTRPNGDAFQVEWRLHRSDDGWKIIDVVVEGISMAVTYRAEFSSVMKSEGGEFGAFLEVLRSKMGPPQDLAISVPNATS